MCVDVDQAQTRVVEVAGQLVPAQRVGLEHGHRVEQVGHTGGALQLRQTDVPVVEHGRLFGLHAHQQLGHPLVRIEPHPHRHRVDEQSDHPLDTGHLRRAVRHRVAEHHVRAPGQDGEQQSPRDLHRGVRGDAVRAAQIQDRRGRGGGQLHADLAAVGGHRALTTGDTGGTLDPGQHPLPGGDRGVVVLRVQPLQVVAVGVRGREVRAGLVGVARQQFVDQQRHRPAVEHDVVVGDDQAELVGPGAHQVEPDQGRAGRIERGGLGGGEHTQTLVRIGRIRQVAGAPGCFGLAEHDLPRPVRALHERGAQAVVPVDECLGGAAHPVRQYRAREGEGGLHGVAVLAVGVVDGMEQQPGLERGQRPHVGHRRILAPPPVEVVLRHRDQREVRRGESARVGGPRVRGQSAQRRLPQPGQLRDLGPVQHLGGVVPGELEFVPVGPVLGDRVDIEHGRQRHPGVDRGGEGGEFGGGRPRPGVFARADPAQVVETDLRLRRTTQHRGAERVQVAQHPVADAVVRHRPQLFLDPPHGQTGGVPAGERVVQIEVAQIESQREPGGEPSDRGRQIGAGHRLFLATVPLQRDQLRAGGPAPRPPPCAQRQAKGGQQGVVRAAVEPGGHGGQHGLGDLGGHPQAHLLRRGRDIAVGVEPARTEQVVPALEHVAPQREFARPPAGRLLDQTVHPPPHRGGRRVEPRVAALGHLRPCLREIAEQDPPRHRVDGEVMHHQPQQIRARVAAVEPHGLHEHAVVGIQPVGGGLQMPVDLGGVAPRQPDAGEHRRGVDRAVLEHVDETVRRAGGAQHRAQHVVPVEHGLDRPNQVVAAQVRGQLDQRRLGEPVVVPAREHGVHDRRQRHRSDAATGKFGQPLGARVGGDQCEPGDGLVVEHVLGGEVQALRLGLCHQPDRQDAVATQREEAVVGADLGHAEHLREQLRHDPFPRRLRSTPDRHGTEVRFRQRPAVHLAEGVDRQALQRHQHRRHHVRRQRRAGESLEFGDIEAVTAHRHHVGGQYGRARLVRDRHGHRQLDVLVPGQCGVDLARLDPVPADLDLEVAAAQQFQLGLGAVGAPPREITGAVHPLPRRTVRVGDESGRGLADPVSVAARQARPGQIQLPRRARRHRLQGPVEHHRRDPADRSAHGAVVAGPQARARGGHGRLGGPVFVQQRPRPGPAFHDVRRADVAPDHDRAQFRQRFGIDRGQHGGGEGQVGDARLGEQPGEPFAADDLRGHHHQRGAAGEAGQELFQRGVEAGRERIGHPRIRGHAVGGDAVGDQPGQPGMGHLHTLRRPGGAGGVGQVRRVGRT